MVACTQKPDSNVFVLKGAVDAHDGEQVYLYYSLGLNNRNSVISDTTLVENGKFEFKGKLDQAVSATISFGDAHDRNNKQRVNFFIEPSIMELTLNNDDFSKSELKGSTINDEWKQINAESEKIREEAAALYKAVEEEKDVEKRDSIRELLEPYTARVHSLYLDFIKNNPDSYLAAYLLLYEKSQLSFEELSAIYGAFSDRVKNSSFASGTKEEIATLKNVQPGATAPYFATVDIHGDSLRITDFKGKYVLLDFWASWCIPCRKGNPHLKALYAEYHDKGLEVICVSDDDSNPDKWREAVAQDGIEAFHHVLRGLVIREKFDRTNSINDKYAIHFLPTKYLIDKEGKMIGKVEEKDLDERLKAIFSE
jgi:thiol-disulfide isomerase/thioredoxin